MPEENNKIEEKLDTLIMIQGKLSIKEMENVESAPYLKSIGFTNKQISSTIGISESGVRKIFFNLNKKLKEKK